MEGVLLEHNEFGPVAKLTGAWSEQIYGYLAANRIPGLLLNRAFGWHGDTVEFVRDLGWLESLVIVDRTLADDSAVNSLHGLRELQLSTDCHSVINYANFPHLERCGVRWRGHSKSLFGCTTLRSLLLTGYMGHDSEPFGHLVNLEKLTIMGSRATSLAGLASLQKLRMLRITDFRKLESLDGLESLVGLEVLLIDTCRRITSLEPLRGLVNLNRLVVDNCGGLDSLAPIAGLKNLEVVGFRESTDILDGDLKPLLALPKLVSGNGFQQRKHYNLRRVDVPRWSTYEEGEAYNAAHPI